MLISEGSTSNDTCIVWCERSEENMLSTKIYYQYLSHLESKPCELEIESQNNNVQVPLFVTSSMLVWECFDKDTNDYTLWIGKISMDSNEITDIMMLNKGNNSFYRHNWSSGDIEISDKYLFWLKFYPGDKSNICWVKLSDIFDTVE